MRNYTTTGIESGPKEDRPTVGQANNSDIEVDIDMGGPRDYGLEGLLDEWLKGAESSLGHFMKS